MLKNKVILVTGSNGGIGFGIAKLCQSKGATVVLHGRNPEAIKAAAAKIGPDTSYVIADLGAADAPEVIINEVVAKHGRIDGLVNNAAALDRCTLETATNELIDRMFTLNFRAPLMLMQAAVAQMKKQATVGSTAGSIVNIGSVNAICGAETLLVYSATKAALGTATVNLGAALARDHIRVNQLNVGWTVTENEHKIQRSEGQPADWQDHIPANFTPSGGLLTPEHIAQHAAFWLSEASAPVTGQTLEIEQFPYLGKAFWSSFE